MKRITASWILLATLALASASPSLGDEHASPASAALNVLPNPGSPPPFVAAEYEKYRVGSGSAIVTARVTIERPGGASQQCMGSTAALYPNTAYTRWMIETWARMLDGRSLAYGKLTPGDDDTGIAVPNVLRIDKIDPDSDVQMSTCDAFNVVTFRNVPAGNYIFMVRTGRLILDGSREKLGTAMANTPFGTEPVMLSEGFESTGHWGDGYVVATHNELPIAAGHSYTIAPSNIVPIAHFLPIESH